ncbi:hypothetical protein [Aeromonas sp. sia0103]|uniref:hypothetical protein n=1 Tax=Aeromonas sp. sia0103 TaxID=2854782 RepID=UPI001C49483B|nr:hypothetical protein [Aeromonas sp. sia0103]MBV7598830.1 hypothetical protein [Aeromonas sp. sia0103]
MATIYPIFFAALSPDAQDDIIARTEHSLWRAWQVQAATCHSRAGAILSPDARGDIIAALSSIADRRPSWRHWPPCFSIVRIEPSP